VFDQLCEQPVELATVGSRERRDERFLSSLDPSVEAPQRTGPGRRQFDEDAAAVVLVADARDQAVLFEVAEQGVHVAAIDQQPASEFSLARGSLLGQRAEHGEVRPAQVVVRECLGDEPTGGRGDPTRQPARELSYPGRRVIFGQVCLGPRHDRRSYLGRPNVGKDQRFSVNLGPANVAMTNEKEDSDMSTGFTSLAEDHLRQLVDRQEIADLITRLGTMIDERSFEDAATILADDVSVQTPGGSSRGSEAVVAQARRNHTVRTQHVITDVLIDLAGDRARARANLTVTFAPDQAGSRLVIGETENSDPRLTLGEVYRFQAIRTDAGWRLGRMEVEPLWSTQPLRGRAVVAQTDRGDT
jgi:hypothetical protein